MEINKIIEFLKVKLPNMSAEFYPNPLGGGWVCDLRASIRNLGIVLFSGKGETQAVAAQKAAESAAIFLGYK